jgi:AcrR family transcriptional regulator
MPPDRRRAHLIATTIPLLLEHGQGLTTRQIAEAADVAEGTIFGVFADKASLVAAVVEEALDPTQFEQDLDRIDRSLPLHDRLVVAVRLLQQRVARIGQLMTASGISAVPTPSGGDRSAQTSIGALARLFEPDRSRLCRSPEACARMLRGLAIASAHPGLSPDGGDPPEEIAFVVLHGVIREEDPRC